MSIIGIVPAASDKYNKRRVYDVFLTWREETVNRNRLLDLAGRSKLIVHRNRLVDNIHRKEMKQFPSPMTSNANANAIRQQLHERTD